MESTRVGDEIRRLRLARALTQRDLADKTGLHVMHISKLERGERRNPGSGTLQALARALGVSIDALLTVPKVRRRTG